MTNEELQKLLDETAEKLGEHFSSVLILASHQDTDAESHFTDGYNSGVGDWYARQGMAMVYIDKTKAKRIADLIKEEEQ
jgi:hypothetical protein